MNDIPPRREIKCPHCGSTDWNCYDESNEWFQDKETQEYFEYPVGFMKCGDCGKSYIHYDLEDVIYIGDDRQMFGSYD